MTAKTMMMMMTMMTMMKARHDWAPPMKLFRFYWERLMIRALRCFQDGCHGPSAVLCWDSGKYLYRTPA